MSIARVTNVNSCPRNGRNVNAPAAPPRERIEKPHAVQPVEARVNSPAPNDH